MNCGSEETIRRLGGSLALPELALPHVVKPLPGRATLPRSPDFPSKSETYRANAQRRIHRLNRSFALPNGSLRLVRSSRLLWVFLLASCLGAWADDALTDLMSPVVSYQYFEAVGQPGSTLMSPVASYQYFDSLGDLVSWQSEGSAPVSYFYNWGGGGPPVAMRGQVIDATGTPIADAQVTISVVESSVAEVQTDGVGAFEFPPLAPGVYALSASAAGMVTSRRVVSLEPQTAWQSFVLSTLPPPPEIVATTEPPQDTLLPKPVVVTSDQLKVFQNGQFVANGNVFKERMTIVLTHGWINPLFATPATGGIHDWPSRLAAALANALGDQVNIVAWDWGTVAYSPLPPESATPAQGVGLGTALWNSLGGDYKQPVHFIGHSLGTLVNAYAADYLHGTPRGQMSVAPNAWDSARTHMSLFDEAEIARVADKEVVFGFVKGLWITKSLAGALVVAAEELSEWKSPIPLASRWVDNYISAAGLYQDQAVNICLQKGISINHGNFIAAHGYPQTWYEQSVARPEASDLGFRQSFEMQTKDATLTPVFPPMEKYPNGIAYHQRESASDELVLEILPETRYEEIFVPAIGVTVKYFVGQAVQTVRTTGTVLITFVERQVVKAQDAATRLIDKADQVIDLGVDSALNLVLETKQLVTGGRVVLHGPDGSVTNEPAYVWLPVAVPADATALAFDFTVTGDPKEDAIAFGINGTNQFSLQGKFLTAGETATSSPIDMAPYAGTTNEFFFGVVGGTSTNCTITVEGLRFYTFAAPALSITNAAGVTLLSWPTTAVGYSLETTPSLSPPVWTAVTNPPAILGSQYIVTNAWSDQTRFFRLRQE